jgi:HAE1 family hydrophobic/amphiphilic exporter-1
MLCSRFLRHQERSGHGRLFNFSERVFDGWLHGYDRSLKAVLRHKFATLMVSFVVIGLTFYLYTISKTGFIPDEDQGLVFAFTEAQQGIAFQDMMQLQQKVADVVRFDPSVMNTMSSIGNPINQGRIFFRLKDKRERASTK